MEQRINAMEKGAGALKAMFGLGNYVAKSSIEKKLQHLIEFRVSQINGCAYCLDMHTRDLSKKGVPLQKLALVQTWQEAGDLFSERERAALAWAESVTRVADTRVPDEVFEAASAVFGEKELADLTMAIGLMNAFNRLAISFRRAPEGAQAAKG